MVFAARRSSQQSRGLLTRGCLGLLPPVPTLSAQHAKCTEDLGLGRGRVGCAFWRAHRGLHHSMDMDGCRFMDGWVDGPVQRRSGGGTGSMTDEDERGRGWFANKLKR